MKQRGRQGAWLASRCFGVSLDDAVGGEPGRGDLVKMAVRVAQQRRPLAPPDDPRRGNVIGQQGRSRRAVRDRTAVRDAGSSRRRAWA
jgi:hypothetical protein